MSIFSTLRREQKEAVGLLSIGTFLEYFDLMLYVHMAVLLNELFFPKTDQFTASLLAAFAFCSTWVFRPIGALIFGYIGDNFGRKSTIIITTAMMALSCLIMANVPTYAEIGITAAWIVTICRIMQGMSSMGENIGAEIYLTESIKPPAQYPVVSILTVFAVSGGMVALFITSLFLRTGISWRVAFWFGAIIALVGTVARTTLRETIDFTNAKKKTLTFSKDLNVSDTEELKNHPMWKEKIDIKTVLSLFFIQCTWPLKFYFVYIYCGGILKTQFGFSPEEVINQNFIVSISPVLLFMLLTYLSYSVYPLYILRLQWFIFSMVMLLSPYLINNMTSPIQLLCLQIFVMISVPTDTPALPIFYRYFPVLKRFTYGCTVYALARAIVHIISSFGLVYLTCYIGHWGILVISMPILIGYKFGLLHFTKLEKESGDYPRMKSYAHSN